VQAQRSWGLTDVELIDGAEARRRFPYLSGDVVNARFRQGDGWLEPRRLALELARASGARFDTGRTVTGFVLHEGRVRGVATAITRWRASAPSGNRFGARRACNGGCRRASTPIRPIGGRCWGRPPFQVWR